MTFDGVCFVYEQMYEGKRLKFDNRALYYPASTTLPADPAHRAEEGRLWGRIMYHVRQFSNDSQTACPYR